MTFFSRILTSLLLVFVLAGCGKPTGTLERYKAARPVVSGADMRPLLELLRREDVSSFNRLRTNSHYANKLLDFTNERFAGLSLKGANISDSILAGVDFSGANLDNASFRNSYVATACLGQPYPLTEDVSGAIVRPTTLANSDFTGAVLKAHEYDQDNENFGAWYDYKPTLYTGWIDGSRAIGLQSLSAGESPLRIDGVTKTVRIPVSPAVPRVRPASELGEACANPFIKIDQRDSPLWGASGVAWETLTNQSALRVRGKYYGAGSVHVVNSDPSLVLVFGSDFGSHGDIYTKGAVVIDGAMLMGNVYAEGPVWLRNEAFPRGEVVGQCILAETTTERRQGYSLLSPVLRVPPVGVADRNIRKQP